MVKLSFLGSKSRQRGSMVAIVLLVSLVLFALFIASHHQSRSALSHLGEKEVDQQLRWIARSGLEATVAQLREDPTMVEVPRRNLPGFPEAQYESSILNNLWGQLGSSGFPAPDGTMWIPSGCAYIQTIGYLNDDEANNSGVGGYAGMVAHQGFSFNAPVFGFSSVSLVDSTVSNFVIASDGNGYLVPGNAGDVVLESNGSISLTSSTVEGAVQFNGQSATPAAVAGVDQVINNPQLRAMPRTQAPRDLRKGKFFLAGSPGYNQRALYPSEFGATRLNGGIVNLGGDIYYIQGDLALNRLTLNIFGLNNRPTTLVVAGNVILDEVRANCYSPDRPGNPQKLKLLVLGDHKVVLRNSYFSGLIYGRDAEVDVVNSDFYGAIASDKVRSVEGRLNYDTSLASEEYTVLGELVLQTSASMSSSLCEEIIEQGFEVANDELQQQIVANHGEEALLPEGGVHYPPMPPVPGTSTTTTGDFAADGTLIDSPPPLEEEPENATDPGINDPSQSYTDPTLGGTLIETGELLDGELPDTGGDVINGGDIVIIDPPPADTTEGTLDFHLNCFAAGTLVRTEQGSRPIEDLKVGDAVTSLDEYAPHKLAIHQDPTGYLSGLRSSVIEEVFVHPDSQIGTVELTGDSGSVELLEVTPEHIVYDVGTASWRPIGSLTLGSHMWSPQGELTVTQAWSFDRVGTTYNIHLERDHTYFVGKLEAWVHNLKEIQDPDTAEEEVTGGNAPDPTEPTPVGTGTGGTGTGGTGTVGTGTGGTGTGGTGGTGWDPGGGSGGGCFVAGTMVATPSGNVAIEELQISDWVYAVSDKAPQYCATTSNVQSGYSLLPYWSPQRVEQVFIHPDKDVGIVTWTDGDRSESIEVTPEHLVYSPSQEKWLGIGSLEVGDTLFSPEGLLTISQAWKYTRTVEVYNIEVEEDHTYFVGKLQAWVHNLKEEAIP